jgi:hypothetical protein
VEVHVIRIHFLIIFIKEQKEPVILATGEAEIKRIQVQSLLGQVVPETLTQKIP